MFSPPGEPRTVEIKDTALSGHNGRVCLVRYNVPTYASTVFRVFSLGISSLIHILNMLQLPKEAEAGVSSISCLNI
jgi:hypothetical protein